MADIKKLAQAVEAANAALDAAKSELESPNAPDLICGYCNEPVKPGEPWTMMPEIRPTGPVFGKWHKECLVRNITGGLAHIKRKCSCYGGSDSDLPEGMTRREEAIATYKLMSAIHETECNTKGGSA